MAVLLATTRTQIAAFIKTQLPSLKTCESHGGRFDLEELRRWGKKAPAVLVAMTDASEAQLAQGVETMATYVIFVITRDTVAALRDVAAINLVQGILTMLPGQVWPPAEEEAENPFVTEPERVSAQNFFSTALDAEGVAMWAISFRQTVSLGDAAGSDLSALDDFIRFTGEATNASDAVLMETYGEFAPLDANGQRITEEENPLLTSDGYYREVE
jgi:hypothetical protein